MGTVRYLCVEGECYAVQCDQWYKWVAVDEYGQVYTSNGEPCADISYGSWRNTSFGLFHIATLNRTVPNWQEHKWLFSDLSDVPPQQKRFEHAMSIL